ncbi:MAG: GNAT family N-acetyltransferase [Rikenellaceae bacterium]|jgi:ribosomal protein S18 acetylase RimI-like enzyme|nr:GNAT family N-acetyltransferase [Rikenellaceae bacterium]
MEILSCDYADTVHREAVAMLIDAYVADGMGGGTPLDDAGRARLLEGLERHPTAIVLLARVDGAFCGLLVAFENFATFMARPMINIHDVIVLREYRGRGTGRRLMRAIADEAARRGCCRITLEVRNDNIIAQRLYRSEGFDETHPRHYYWRKYL